jgi:hypothetical protein
VFPNHYRNLRGIIPVVGREGGVLERERERERLEL